MSSDFERYDLKELFSSVEAFLGLSIGILAGLIVLLGLMLWGHV